ncbi:phage tail protein [Terasakiella pusilla]|uniref:phage tail protein n=1 Tax=Terasakiella pusilla TaxID=64973 RepID=UPI003AA7DF2F
MNKLEKLRTYLLEGPLKIRSKELLTFAEKGKVFSSQNPNDKSFGISYRANIILAPFTGSFNAVNFILLNWLQENQTNLKEEDIAFHVDIIDHETSHVSWEFPLSEIIKVIPQDEGHTLSAQIEANVFGFDIYDLTKNQTLP